MGQHNSISAYQQYFSRSLSDVTSDLQKYEALLIKWQAVQNLVSRETLPQLWNRHFADSLQTLKFVSEADVRFLDIGSGGGFPALPMAIAGKRSKQQFTLVEPTSRKVSFLRTVARELDLTAIVQGQRIEQVDSRETRAADVITSRALAELSSLFAMSHAFVGGQTRLLLHKGREHVEELRAASAQWQFDVLIHLSDTSDDGVILEIRNLRSRSLQ